MRYKLQLPGKPDATFDHADEFRSQVFDVGFQHLKLWITNDDGKTWGELPAQAVQAIFSDDGF